MPTYDLIKARPAFVKTADPDRLDRPAPSIWNVVLDHRSPVGVLVAAFCILAGCTSPVQPVTGTPLPGGTSWRVEVGRGIAGQPDRLVLIYHPYLSAPVANEIHFVAVCSSCESGTPPLLGRLLLTPEFCASSSTRPGGQICWSAPITFPRAGVWHFTSPYDADIRIQ